MSTEGINGTVGGSILATDIYIKTMCSHALFNSMEEEDFKVRLYGDPKTNALTAQTAE